jgi:16S rRNA (guanine527-N7)-methyltransferase
MSPPGRPKGELRSAQHEGIQASPPGRPRANFAVHNTKGL